MIEVTAGIFVGRLSALVRDKLWTKITERKGDGGAAIVQVKDNEQHFNITMDGFPERSVIDFDGMQLVRVKHDTGKSAKACRVGVTEVVKLASVGEDGAGQGITRKRRTPEVKPPTETETVEAPFNFHRLYWSSLAVPFQEITHDLCKSMDLAGTLASWNDALKKLAWRAFTAGTKHLINSRKGIKALANAERKFAGLLKHVLTQATVATATGDEDGMEDEAEVNT